MLNVFTLANGRLFQEEIESHAALAHVQPVWSTSTRRPRRKRAGSSSASA